jgi:hypothetical protein
MRKGAAMKDYAANGLADVELGDALEPADYLSDIERREAKRSTGPGTAARRTLEALAESRRLNRELADLDSYEDA